MRGRTDVRAAVAATDDLRPGRPGSDDLAAAIGGDCFGVIGVDVDAAAAGQSNGAAEDHGNQGRVQGQDAAAGSAFSGARGGAGGDIPCGEAEDRGEQLRDLLAHPDDDPITDGDAGNGRRSADPRLDGDLLAAGRNKAIFLGVQAANLDIVRGGIRRAGGTDVLGGIAGDARGGAAGSSPGGSESSGSSGGGGRVGGSLGGLLAKVHPSNIDDQAQNAEQRHRRQREEHRGLALSISGVQSHVSLSR